MPRASLQCYHHQAISRSFLLLSNGLRAGNEKLFLYIKGPITILTSRTPVSYCASNPSSQPRSRVRKRLLGSPRALFNGTPPLTARPAHSVPHHRSTPPAQLRWFNRQHGHRNREVEMEGKKKAGCFSDPFQGTIHRSPVGLLHYKGARGCSTTLNKTMTLQTKYIITQPPPPQFPLSGLSFWKASSVAGFLEIFRNRFFRKRWP